MNRQGIDLLSLSAIIFFNLKTNLAIVCPITNTNNKLPLHIPLDERTKTTGVILCEHIKALDIEARGYTVIE